MVKFQFLLPIDDSAFTEIAADNVIKLAKMYNAEISTVHVVDTDIFKDDENLEIQTRSGQVLLDKFNKYCSDAGVGIFQSSVLTGLPFNEIIKMENEIDATLIVLGAPDNKLGRVAEKVVRGAKCHVMIARKITGSLEPYKHILVPVDGSEDAEYAAKFAASITHRSKSKLTVCHVIHNQNKMPEGKAIIEKVMDIIKSKDITANSLIKEGNITEEILKSIEKEEIDLIVMGYSGRGSVLRLILGSVSEKVVRSASCSVFLVKSLRTEKVYTVKK
jgi:nucleotide-binding universal stress UspA family protein